MVAFVLHDYRISEPVTVAVLLEGHDGPFPIAFVAGVLQNMSNVPRWAGRKGGSSEAIPL